MNIKRLVDQLLEGNSKPRASECSVSTWFERDRKHIHVFRGDENDTVVEWRDEAVDEAVEDGFLDPRDWEGSALKYAVELGFITD